MKRFESLGASSLAVLAFAVGSPGPVWAQTRDDVNDKRTIEELVVTASKREERLQDVPQSITALTGDELQRQGVLEFSDYARRVPGLLFQDQGRSGPGRGSNVVIRGITTNLAQGFQAPTVAIYIDETPIPNFFAPNPIDLERIEILRGPQGTLYGAQSLGGAIKFIPRRPNLKEFGGEVAATFSMTDASGDPTNTFSGVLNVPLVEDRLGIRLVAGRQHLGGWLDNDRSDPLGLFRSPPRFQPRDDVNDTEVENGRAEIRAAINERLTIDVLALYERAKYQAAPQYDPRKPGFVQTGLHLNDEGSNTKTTLFNGRISYNLGFADLTWSSSFVRREVFYVFDGGVFNRRTVDRLATGSMTSNFFRDPLSIEETSTLEQTTHEARLSSNSDGWLRWQAGFFRQSNDSHGGAVGVQPGCSAFPNICNDRDEARPFTFVNRAANDQYAAFGELSVLPFGDKLQLTVGGRRFTFKIDSVGSNAAGGGNSLETKITDHILKFGANLRPSSETLIFAQASQGYRNGLRNAPIPPPATSFRDVVEPDTLWNYELGVKKEWFGRLTTNLSLFYIDWSDIQLNVVSESGFLFTANAGQAHTKGVEAEIYAQPVPGLDLQLAIAWLEAELDNTIPTVGGAIEGARLPGTPEWTASSAASYDWELSNGLTLTPRLDYQYRDVSFSSFGVTSGVKLTDYHLLNARLILAKQDDWSLTAFGENLLNEHPVIGNNAFGQVPQLITIRPRTFGVSVRKSF